MISYELAKELRDAGFKQPDKDCGGKSLSAYNAKGTDMVYDNCCGEWHDDIDAYIPSLSELIDACGDEFHCLVLTCGGGIDSNKMFWSAGKDKTVMDWNNGSTPEEAVARLWLALNKKNA